MSPRASVTREDKAATSSSLPPQHTTYGASAVPPTTTDARLGLSAPNTLLESTWFRLAGAFTDLAGLVVAWNATAVIRYLLNPVMDAQLSFARIQELAPPLALVLVVWSVVAMRLGLYRKHTDFSAAYYLLAALETMSVVSVLFVVVTLFSHGIGADVSRSLVLLFGPIAFVTSVASRCTTVLAANAVAMRLAPDRVAIAGSYAEVLRILATIENRWGTCISGVIISREHHPAHENVMGSLAVPVLGTVDSLPAQINQRRINRILIAGGLSQAETIHCAKIAGRMGVVVSHMIPAGLDAVGVHVRTLYGVPQIEVRAAAFTRKQEILKRAFDICAASVALILLAPLFILLMTIVKLTSRGPVFYVAHRVGRGGRYFSFFKFRSMYLRDNPREEVAASNEKNGHLFKLKNDPRVTPFGRFLRRYSLDELPQLCNVLIGDMSLVGPRPLPIEDLDPDGMSRDFKEWAEERARVLPGITGLWQINGRSDLDFEQLIHWDMEYIRTWSLALDIRILLKTPAAVLGSRGAY